jgi:hypothetical protein
MTVLLTVATMNDTGHEYAKHSKIDQPITTKREIDIEVE